MTKRKKDHLERMAQDGPPVLANTNTYALANADFLLSLTGLTLKVITIIFFIFNSKKVEMSRFGLKY